MCRVKDLMFLFLGKAWNIPCPSCVLLSGQGGNGKKGKKEG